MRGDARRLSVERRRVPRRQPRRHPVRDLGADRLRLLQELRRDAAPGRRARRDAAASAASRSAPATRSSTRPSRAKRPSTARATARTTQPKSGRRARRRDRDRARRPDSARSRRTCSRRSPTSRSLPRSRSIVDLVAASGSYARGNENNRHEPDGDLLSRARADDRVRGRRISAPATGSRPWLQLFGAGQQPVRSPVRHRRAARPRRLHRERHVHRAAVSAGERRVPASALHVLRAGRAGANVGGRAAEVLINNSRHAETVFLACRRAHRRRLALARCADALRRRCRATVPLPPGRPAASGHSLLTTTGRSVCRRSTPGAAINVPDAPTWLPSGKFVYRKSVKGGRAFVIVDPATGTKRGRRSTRRRSRPRSGARRARRSPPSRCRSRRSRSETMSSASDSQTRPARRGPAR